MMVKKIPLSKGEFAIIDDEDYEWVSLWSWHTKNCNGKFYAYNDFNGYLHRAICFVSKGIEFENNEEIDHINGNSLDNRQNNLRAVTHRQNQQNRHHNKTSEYPGVTWSKTAKLWRSNISINGKPVWLGDFKIEKHAFEAYKKAVHDLGELLVCELSSSVDEGQEMPNKSPLPPFKEGKGNTG